MTSVVKVHVRDGSAEVVDERGNVYPVPMTAPLLARMAGRRERDFRAEIGGSGIDLLEAVA